MECLNEPQVQYLPKLLTDSQANWALNYLIDNVPWHQVEYNFNGRTVKAPRLTALFGDREYEYSGVSQTVHPISPVIARMLEIVNGHDSSPSYNSALLNYYRDGKDSISMHSDDEKELGQNPTVSSLSLGDSRIFKLQHKQTGEVYTYKLNHGDYIVMLPGTQAMWKHGIDKEHNRGPRVSVTFRKVI
jgi:alkylated DNA repair dioxygenase AlkB